MLSKNNNNLWNEKMEPKKQRFAIKKFTVGVASVLIGTTFAFYAGGNSVSADDSINTSGGAVTTEVTDTADPEKNNAKKVTLSASAQDTANTSSNVTENTQTDSSNTTDTASSDVSDEQAVTNTNENKDTEATTVTEAATGDEANATETPEVNSTAVSDEAKVAETNETSDTKKAEVANNNADVASNDTASDSQDSQVTLRNRALSSSLIQATNATTPSGATQTEKPAPTDGYSVTDVKPSYANGYNQNNVPLDPNTSHYTVNSYVVTNAGSPGEIGENSRKGLGNRYAYSVSEADVEGTGLPTKFYVMKFDGNNVVTKTIEIPTDAQGGTSYKIDDYAQVIVANTATGSKSFSIQKFTDDTNWFTPVYSVFGNQVNEGGATSQLLAIPQWVVETTTYKDQDGNELRPEYSQYGWEDSSFTTEPIVIDGYDVRATQDYVSGEYDQNIPADQKNGKLVVSTPYKKGSVITGSRTYRRGTLYSKSTVIDDKGTVEYRAWFTYAKAPGTFSQTGTTDKGRVAADLPPVDYDFINNPNNYTILDPTQMTLNSADEAEREKAGQEGKVVFQQLRFLYTDPANQTPPALGDDGKNNQTGNENYNDPQKSYDYTILPYGTNSWGTYDTGRTFTISNPVVYPSLINYVYWTQKATITYIDDTTGKTLHTDEINGALGTTSKYSPFSNEYSGNSTIGQDKPRTTETISDYEKQGYVLVSNNYPTGGAQFTKDGEVQNFVIHFVQGVQPVTPTTPPTDVPDKTPDNARPDALTKDVTLNVNYVNSDGSTFTGTIPTNAQQKLTFNGLAYINKVTGQLVNAKQDANGNWIVDTANTATPEIAWTPDNSSFTAVTSPTERGYHVENVSSNADGDNVAAIDGITKDSNNINITVTYAPNGTKLKNVQNVKASQKVKYVDESGNELSPTRVSNFDFNYSGDTYDAVTNELISRGSWDATSHDFTAEDVPVINGYVAVRGYSRDDNDKVIAGGFTTTPGASEAQRNRTYTVVYKKVGNIVPQDPSGNPIPNPTNPTENVPSVPYTNDPTDPTKVTPDEPVPTIDGYTPNQNKVTPPDPTKDTPVIYVKNVEQKAKVQYIDLDDNNRVMSESDTLSGKAGEKINYSTATDITNYENKGYVLVSDGFSGNPIFDNVDGNEQVFKVTFRHGTQPVTPTDPGKPGKPINPDDPEGPKYPDGSDQVTKNVTRTINYVDEQGNKLSDSVKQTINFTAQGVLDKVTGKWITPLTWSQSQTINGVKSPVVPGYHLVSVDKDQDGNNVAGVTLTHENDSYTVTVTYAPNGKLIPVDPDGNPIPSVPTPQYPTDPTDPSKVTPTPVPNVPGYEPDNPNPVTPTDPGKDTPVPYHPVTPTPVNDQKAIVNYVDADDNNKVITSSPELTGKAGETIDYSTATTIADLEKQGYVLVNDGFTVGSTYDNDDNTTQVFTVVLRHGTQPVTPTDPGKPGKPINPDDPEGPKYPDGSDQVTKNVTRTINYVDEQGNTVSESVEQTINFTAQGVLDKVTGKWITPLTWSQSQTINGVKSPVVPGYHLVSVDKDQDGNNVAGVTLTHENNSYTVTVTYAPNGKLIPVDPDGNPIPNVPTPQYPTDPTDPSKVTPTPVPNVPGYEPDNPNPVTPTDPGKDTPVPYHPVVEDKYSLTERFVDEEGNELSASVTKGTDYKEGTEYDVTGDAKVINGYYLIKTSDNAKGKFGKDNVTVTFTYAKLGKIVPVDPNGTPIPDAPTPQYPNDPTDPSKTVPNQPVPEIPGYRPEVPT
ncbi:MucBP domain-containing protein, partial [Ligilactobacillus faecis]